jgi:hypothetical protein
MFDVEVYPRDVTDWNVRKWPVNLVLLLQRRFVRYQFQNVLSCYVLVQDMTFSSN